MTVSICIFAEYCIRLCIFQPTPMLLITICSSCCPLKCNFVRSVWQLFWKAAIVFLWRLLSALFIFFAWNAELDNGCTIGDFSTHISDRCLRDVHKSEIHDGPDLKVACTIIKLDKVCLKNWYSRWSIVRFTKRRRRQPDSTPTLQHFRNHKLSSSHQFTNYVQDWDELGVRGRLLRAAACEVDLAHRRRFLGLLVPPRKLVRKAD